MTSIDDISTEDLATEYIINHILKCDKEIADFREQMNPYMTIFNSTTDETKKAKCEIAVENLNIMMKLLLIERNVYKASMDINNNSIFPIFLSRYDELMSSSYDVSSKLVELGFKKEGSHLKYCSGSLRKREHIKTLCDYCKNRK